MFEIVVFHLYLYYKLIKHTSFCGDELYLTIIEWCCEEKTVEFYDWRNPFGNYKAYYLEDTNLFFIITEIERRLIIKSKIYEKNKNKRRARDEFVKSEFLKRQTW